MEKNNKEKFQSKPDSPRKQNVPRFSQIKKLSLTVLGLCCSEVGYVCSDGVGEEGTSGGAEEWGYVGDTGKLGEGGRELLLPFKFGILMSRKSPPLTSGAAERCAEMELHKRMWTLAEHNVKVTLVTCVPVRWEVSKFIGRFETGDLALIWTRKCRLI